MYMHCVRLSPLGTGLGVSPAVRNSGFFFHVADERPNNNGIMGKWSFDISFEANLQILGEETRSFKNREE